MRRKEDRKIAWQSKPTKRPKFDNYGVYIPLKMRQFVIKFGQKIANC